MIVIETSLRLNKIYVIGYVFWIKFIFVEVIPYLTIVVLNYAIARKSWKSRQFRQRLILEVNFIRLFFTFITLPLGSIIYNL